MEQNEVMDALTEMADKFIEESVKSDAELFHIDVLINKMREAYIAGYVNGATTVNFMQCQDCPKNVKRPPIKFIGSLNEK